MALDQLSALSRLLKRVSPTARLLIVCRAVRSLGQGALVVDFALYLHALSWSAVEIGEVYVGGLLLGASLTLLAGPLSDLFGRKPFLVGYAVSQVMAALVALSTSEPRWLVAAAIVGAFGRGANGAAGPFGPVEQAWLSQGLSVEDYAPIYGMNAAVGYGGMAAGAFMAALPPLWAHWLPGALRYRPLFLLVAVGALITLWLLPRMTETRDLAPDCTDEQAADSAAGDWEHQRGMLLRLVGINAVNGLAAGVMGPFMALWFHLRYGAGPEAIGPVMALGFLLSTITALWTASLMPRVGTALSVVLTRLVGVALLALLPFAPNYGLAAGIYVLRAAFNRGSAGARQVLGLRLVGPTRRGLAASLNSVSMQIPRALGPLIGGALLDADLLVLPLLVAAALQMAYLTLYGLAFRHIE